MAVSLLTLAKKDKKEDRTSRSNLASLWQLAMLVGKSSPLSTIVGSPQPDMKLGRLRWLVALFFDLGGRGVGLLRILVEPMDFDGLD